MAHTWVETVDYTNTNASNVKMQYGDFYKKRKNRCCIIG